MHAFISGESHCVFLIGLLEGFFYFCGFLKEIKLLINSKMREN